MIPSVCFVLATFASCAGNFSVSSNAKHSEIVPLATVEAAPLEDSFSVRIGKFALRLNHVDSRCVVEASSDEVKTKQIDTNMRGPCDFIGRRIKPLFAQTYDFGEGQDKVTVLLVTGGPAHPRFRDNFMPEGCGTRLAKVRVYDDRIEVQRASEADESTVTEPVAYCPSNPLDEVFFATG